MPYKLRLRRTEPRTVAPPQPAQSPKLDELRKADLVALATEKGVDAEGTKAELIERLTDG